MVQALTPRPPLPTGGRGGMDELSKVAASCSGGFVEEGVDGGEGRFPALTPWPLSPRPGGEGGNGRAVEGGGSCSGGFVEEGVDGGEGRFPAITPWPLSRPGGRGGERMGRRR